MRLYLGLLLAGIALHTAGPHPAHGQSAYDLYGSARASALGYAATALTTTAGGHANPGAKALHQRRLVTFFAREGFGLTSLRYGSVYGTWPTRWGVLSTSAGTFGGDAYREMHFSLGSAWGLQLGTSRNVYFGLTARYYHTQIENYGSAGALGVHLGLLVSLLPSLYFGAHVTNVNSPSLVDEESLPQTLAIGLQYRATSRLLVVMDVFKDIAFPTSLRAGLEVRPIPRLALRAGVTSTPTRFTGGVGFQFGRIRAHVAAEQHHRLGWSPSASLEVQW